MAVKRAYRDSMKYHHADTSVDYMTFLEECRKAEDKDRAGKSKIKGKLENSSSYHPFHPEWCTCQAIKKAAATIWHSNGQNAIYDSHFTITILPRPQQHSGRETLPLEWGREVGLHIIIMMGEEDLEVGACLPNLDGKGRLNHRDPPLSLVSHAFPTGAGDCKNLYWQPMLAVWGSGTPQKELSHAKRQGAVSRRECMNSLIASQSHSPYLSKTTNVGGKNVARETVKFKNSKPRPLDQVDWKGQWGKDNSEWKDSDCFAGHWKPGDTY